MLKAFFEGGEEEIPFVLRRESDEFTYGYALTVHKAQGSQWDDLVLFDESYAFREHRQPMALHGADARGGAGHGRRLKTLDSGSPRSRTRAMIAVKKREPSGEFGTLAVVRN